jgi:hypothetical protein
MVQGGKDLTDKDTSDPALDHPVERSRATSELRSISKRGMAHHGELGQSELLALDVDQFNGRISQRVAQKGGGRSAVHITADARNCRQ